MSAPSRAPRVASSKAPDSPALPMTAGQQADGPVTESPPVHAWRPEPGWRECLAGRDPDLILERLLDGDPLRLRGLVAHELRQEALFLDADRLHLRALARVAHDVTIDGPPADGAWVRDHVRAASLDVLEAERSAVSAARRRGGAQGTESHGHAPDPFSSLASPLGLEGVDLRVACDAFNRRATVERLAFFALFVERLGLDDAARRQSIPPTELARRARAALMAVLETVRSARSSRTSNVHPKQSIEVSS